MWVSDGAAGVGGSGTGGRSQGYRSAGDLFAEAVIASYVDDARFVPRPWLLGRIQEALDVPRARFVLLIGEPGAGKSTVMAHLARLHPEAPRYFVRRDSATALQGGDARTFLFSIGHQLARTHPSLFDPGRLEVVVRQRTERLTPGGRIVGIEVQDLRASPFYTTALEVIQSGAVLEGELIGISANRMTLEPRLLELSNLQYLALLDPAQASAEEDPQARIVILVDALDEIRHGQRGEDLLSWLATSPELPPNVRFVLTSRPDRDLLDPFRRAKAAELVELQIDPQGDEDRDRIQEDLRRFLNHFVAEPPVARALRTHDVQPTSFVKEAIDKAGGNFQYAVALTRGIDRALAAEPSGEDLPALLTLTGVPLGMSELYRFFLGRIKANADRAPVKVSTGLLAEPEDRPAWDTLYRPVLSVLAVAFEPLSSKQLNAYAAVAPGWLPRALEDLAQFLVPDRDGRYRLYHTTFPEFLVGDATASPDDPFHVDPATWHGLLAGRLLRANPDWLVCQDRYALAHTPAHLVEAGRPRAGQQTDQAGIERELTDALAALLVDLAFLQAKTARLQIDSLFADFRQAPAVVGDDERVRGVQRVLEREAHHLRSWEQPAEPAFFAQQLHNRAVQFRLPFLSGAAGRLLDEIGRPALRLRWRASGESEAVERVLTGHTESVESVVLTGDGRAVSGSFDGSLRVWDIDHGKQLAILGGSGSSVWTVALTGDGRILSGYNDGVLRVWDLERGTEIAALAGHDSAITSVAVTNDGRAVSGSLDGTIRVWNIDRAEVLAVLAGHEWGVRTLALTGDGQVVAGSDFGMLHVWDLERAKELARFDRHQGAVRAIAVAGDGRVVSASADATLRVWDLERRRELAILSGHASGVTAVVLTGEGRVVSASADATLRVWSLDAGQELAVLSGHQSAVAAVVLTGDGRAVSASSDRTLRVWDLERASELAVLTGHSHFVDAVAVTMDGRAVSASHDKTLRVWSLQEQLEARARVGHLDAVRSIIVTADARALSASDDRTIRVWDLRSGAELAVLKGHAAAVRSLALIGDTQAVSGSDDGTLRVWDIGRGEEIAVLGGHEGGVTALALTRHGLVAADSHGVLRLWDINRRKVRAVLQGHSETLTALAAADDGQVVCGWENGILSICDLRRKQEFLVGGSHLDLVTAIVLPDRRRAVSASDDGTLRVIDLQRREQVAVLAGHESWVTAVALTGDGRVVSGSRDATIRVWELERGEELVVLRGHEADIGAIALTDDRRVVSTSADGTVRVWRPESRSTLAMAPLDATPTALQLYGQQMVVGDDAGGVGVYELVDRLGPPIVDPFAKPL